MKRIIAILCLLSILLVTGIALCSCGSELDNSFRSADKHIKARNDPSKYPHGGEYSSETIYREEENEYDYIITVDIKNYTGGQGYADKVDDLVSSMATNMKGYFSDNENVTVYVKVYNDSQFIREYKNWELVG